MTRETEGYEYYYRWSTMFDSDFPSEKTWQLFTQWHHEGGQRLAAGGVLRLRRETIRLHMRRQPGVVWTRRWCAASGTTSSST